MDVVRTSPDEPSTARTRRDPASSMSLLVDLATNSLDAGYAEAARRRAERAAAEAGDGSAVAGTAPGSSVRARTVVLVMLVVVGLLLATAAVQQHRRAPAAARLKSGLRDEVVRRTASTDAQQ